MYCSSTVLSIGQMITYMVDTDINMEPVWWTIFYVLSVILQIIGGYTLWRTIRIVGIIIVIIPVMYCLMAIKNGDFEKFAPYPDVPDRWFVGGASGFMSSLLYAAWWFVGVETMPLCCIEAIEVCASHRTFSTLTHSDREITLGCVNHILSDSVHTQHIAMILSFLTCCCLNSLRNPFPEEWCLVPSHSSLSLSGCYALLYRILQGLILYPAISLS
jgi:hypothetical protein